MAVDLDGGTGLFDRLGRMGHLLNTINARRGGASSGDYPVELNDVLEEFDGGTNRDRATVARLLDELSVMQQGHDGMLNALKEAAQALLIAMFDADDPLAELSVEAALQRLKIQMLTATTRFVASNTIGCTVTSTGNTGDGNVVTATKDGLGETLENLLAEDLEITVTDTSTAGAPQLRVRGEVAQADKLHFSWPAGSGSDASYTAINASDASANLVTNGDFEDFTANAPDNWTIIDGAAGTEILQETVTIYAGVKAIEFVGDDATLTQIRQNIVANVESHVVYGLSFWGTADVVPAAGELTIDLFDGSAVIEDEQGVAQEVTFDLTNWTTDFVGKTWDFRLPEPLPAAVWLRVHLSTALSTGSSIFLDHLAVALLGQPGGENGQTPFAGFFSGATDWALDDGPGNGVKVFKIAVANDRAGTWQQLFDKFYGTADLGYVLPIAGSDNIDPALIG